MDVYTFEEKLDSINVIYTEPLNYVGFRDTLMITCKTSHPKDVKVVPDKVRIGFYTDVLTEESLDGVPIQAINMPPESAAYVPAKGQGPFCHGCQSVPHITSRGFHCDC